MKRVTLQPKMSEAALHAMLANLYPNYSLAHICEQAYRDLYKYLKRVQTKARGDDMNIIVEPNTVANCFPTREFDYSAHLDSYDGAPDAGVAGNWIGYGPTAELAEQDLWEQIADWLEDRLHSELCHD